MTRAAALPALLATAGRWLRALLLAAVACAGATPARAQGMLESVLAPGPLSKAHAKYEDNCKTCHVKFDRNAQDRLCADCHKDIGRDLRARTGLHGRMSPRACRSCHTEHKGRDARIVQLDKTRFDHGQTNYTLRGAHLKVDCARCHVPAATHKGYRLPVHDCVSCHRAKDAHKGSLGPACADCHTETSWKQAKFDHATTRFALTGKHADVKCDDCHRGGRFKDTPLDCASCHRQDDHHKTRFGDRCDTCHVATGWKDIRFDHDTQTHFALRGRHREAKCERCHTGFLYRDKLPTTCVECHRKDDKHQGTLGTDCASCHTERDWKEPARFDHARTEFPLMGKHADVACKDCHRDQRFRETPKACNDCHAKDDRHKGSLGTDCASCHDAAGWKKTRFDHQATRFPLLGKHQTAKCADCHKDARYRQTATDCIACHRNDDKHQGQEGKTCGDCHDTQGWKPAPRFDHGLVAFPLLGKHQRVECKSCHVSLRFHDTGAACVSCHAKDDRHHKTLGTQCEQCHNAGSWKAWRFDHDRTRFPLDGKHTGLACKACHTQPIDGRPAISTQCASCHARDDVHGGAYGKACQQCHVTSGFRTIHRPGLQVGRAAHPGREVS